MVDDIGLGNVMWSTDFPHLECAWPDSMKLADEMFSEINDDDRWQITAGNAIKYFNLEA